MATLAELEAIHGKASVYADPDEPDLATFSCGAKAEADRATGDWAVTHPCSKHAGTGGAGH